MLHLFGVNHSGQHRGVSHDPEIVCALECVAQRIFFECNVSVIAEEFSGEACRVAGVERSVCEEMASSLSILHVYCDPTSDERQQYGIPTHDDIRTSIKSELGLQYMIGEEASELLEKRNAQYHAKRESVWASKIQRFRIQHVMFVCGSDHVQSFGSVLKSSGWDIGAV